MTNVQKLRCIPRVGLDLCSCLTIHKKDYYLETKYDRKMHIALDAVRDTTTKLTQIPILCNFKLFTWKFSRGIPFRSCTKEAENLLFGIKSKTKLFPISEYGA